MGEVRKRKPAPRRRPVDETEGPWLIWSHHWACWHRRSSDGGACGYTSDIAHAGVFEVEKARGYHDWQRPGGRDEAIPAKRVAKQLTARLRELEAETSRLAGQIANLTDLGRQALKDAPK